MGLEQFGIYALVAGFLSFTTPLDFGLGQGVTKYVSGYAALSNGSGIRRCVLSAVNASLIVGILLSIIAAFFAVVAPKLLGVPAPLTELTRLSFLIGTPGLAISILGGILSSSFMGLQRYELSSLLNVLSNVCIALSAMLMAILGISLPVILMTNVLILLIGMIWAWLMLKKLLPGLKFQFVIELNELRRLYQFSSYAFLSQVSNLVSVHAVRYTVGIVLGTTAVSYYVIPTKIISAVGGLLSSGFGVLFPYASALLATSQRLKIQRSYIDASRLFANLAVPVLLLMALFSNPILSLWMGPEFASKTDCLLRVLALSSLVASLTTVPNTIVLGLGHSRIVGSFSVISVLLYIGLLSPFSKTWGLIGTAFVGLVATIPGLVLVGIETEKIVQIRPFYYLKSVLGFHVVPFVAVLLWIILMPIRVADSPVIPLSAAGILAISYLAIMNAFGWIDVRSLLAAIRNRPE